MKGSEIMLQSEVFDWIENNGVPFLRFKKLEQTNKVIHGFSTRLGGVSTGIYESMNLNFNRGDKEEAVRENFKRFCNSLGVAPESMVFSDQIHEDVIRVVTKEDCGKGYNKESDIKGIDGLITNEPGVTLVTSYADCVPLYFLDPVKSCIGLSHAGWRGTVKRIGPKTVKKMQEVFGCVPSDIIVGIGPSIGQCCFEVSEDVKIEVEKATNHDIIDKIKKNTDNGKYHIDLWALNAYLLEEAGIKAENIIRTDICTMCHSDILFSHRATNGQRGGLVAMMALKQG